jgi:hypothetical protein
LSDHRDAQCFLGLDEFAIENFDKCLALISMKGVLTQLDKIAAICISIQLCRFTIRYCHHGHYNGSEEGTKRAPTLSSAQGGIDCETP